MPVWLTWKLFWKVAPYLGGALALIGAVWYLDHRGYKRAQNEAKLEKALEDNTRLELRQYIDTRVKSVEGGLADMVMKIDENIHSRLGQLDIENRTVVQPTLIREIQSDARFSNPDVGITDGMLNALNKARSASSSSCTRTPNGGIKCSLSEPTPP